MPETTLDPDIARLLSDPTNTEDVAKAYLMMGLEAEDRLDWEDAVEQYLRVVELARTNEITRYFGHNNLAYSLLQLRRFADAEKHCLAAIDINVDRHNAHKNLGLAYEALGNLDDAAICLANAAYRAPADNRAWLHLQHLLGKAPDLLVRVPDLAGHVEVVQKLYEANGGIPRAN